MNEIKLDLSSGVYDVFMAPKHILKKLLDDGYDVNRMTETYGDTLLSLFVLNRNIDKINILLEYNPDISVRVRGDLYRTLFYGFDRWYWSPEAAEVLLRLLEMDTTGDVLLIKSSCGDNVINHMQTLFFQRRSDYLLEESGMKPYDKRMAKDNIRFLDFFVKTCENHLRKTSTLFNMMFKDVDLNNKKQRVY